MKCHLLAREPYPSVFGSRKHCSFCGTGIVSQRLHVDKTHAPSLQVMFGATGAYSAFWKRGCVMASWTVRTVGTRVPKPAQTPFKQLLVSLSTLPLHILLEITRYKGIFHRKRALEQRIFYTSFTPLIHVILQTWFVGCGWLTWLVLTGVLLVKNMTSPGVQAIARLVCT